MARLTIDTGTEGNVETCDTLRTAMTKINTNFLEVYTDLAATTSSNGILTNSDTNGDVKIQANGTGIVEVDQLLITDDAITSLVTNSDLTLSGNGTGNVHINDDSLIVGVNNTNATITTLGTGDLTLSTNGGTDSGTIEIKDGANADVTITANGTGDIVLGAVTVADNKITSNESNANLQIDASGTGAVEILTTVVLMANLPTSDPTVAGQLFRDGTDLKVSVG